MTLLSWIFQTFLVLVSFSALRRCHRGMTAFEEVFLTDIPRFSHGTSMLGRVASFAWLETARCFHSACRGLGVSPLHRDGDPGADSGVRITNRR
jgi:hypothetical protein